MTFPPNRNISEAWPMKVTSRSPAAVGRTSVSNPPAAPAGTTAMRTSGIINSDIPFMLSLPSKLC